MYAIRSYYDNHRFFQEYLTAELDNAEKNTGKLSLLFIDIDNFKYYNDMYGHSRITSYNVCYTKLLR